MWSFLTRGDTPDVALEKRAARALDPHAQAGQDSSRDVLAGLRELLMAAEDHDQDDDHDVHLHHAPTSSELAFSQAARAEGDCLDAAELEQYVRVGRLPDERNAHLSSCAQCQALVASAKLTPAGLTEAVARLASRGDSDDFLNAQRTRRELRIRQEAAIEHHLRQKRATPKAAVHQPSTSRPVEVPMGQQLIWCASGAIAAVFAIFLLRGQGEIGLHLPAGQPPTGYLVDKTGGEIDALNIQPDGSQDVHIFGKLRVDSSRPTLEVVELRAVSTPLEAKAAAKGDF
jgi:hypothetical protein